LLLQAAKRSYAGSAKLVQNFIEMIMQGEARTLSWSEIYVLKSGDMFFFQMTAWRSISNKMLACPKTCAEQASMKRLEKCMEALLHLPHYLIPSLS